MYGTVLVFGNLRSTIKPILRPYYHTLLYAEANFFTKSKGKFLQLAWANGSVQPKFT